MRQKEEKHTEKKKHLQRKRLYSQLSRTSPGNVLQKNKRLSAGGQNIAHNYIIVRVL